MPISSDIAVATNGNITWTGTTANYTVLEFHRFLQDLADDAAASGNDLVDITSSTPSERSTDNIITLLAPYNITDEVAEHLYDGSITQNNGDTVYSGLRVLGAVNNVNTELQIIQNNALYDGASPFWGTQASGGYNGNAAAGILMQIMVKSRVGGADIDGKRIRVQARHWGDTYDFFNVTLGQGVSVAAIGTTPDAQNDTLQATVTAYTHILNSGGTANAPTGGYQTINLNNGNGAQPYYSKWTYGANTSGDGLKGMWEYLKDLTGNGTAKTIDGINGELFLGITHQWAYDNEASGPFVHRETLSWGTGATAGTGLLLALQDSGTTGTMWIQLLTGVAPTDNTAITGGTSSATCDVQGAVTSRTVPKIFMGSYTGSLIGSFGFGVDEGDLTASDTIQDLLGVTQTPPNSVTFTVSSLVSGDRVLVAPRGYRFAYDSESGGPFTVGETLTFTSPAGTAVLAELIDNGTTGYMITGPMLTGSAPTDNSTISGGTSSATAAVNGTVFDAIDTRQMSLNGALTGGSVTSVVVNGTIPSDTPTTGTIRIKRADGVFTSHPYSAYSGSTFTITSHNFSTNNAANGANVFVSYIDKAASSSSEQFTTVYSANRALYIRVRDGGGTPIKTFEITSTLTSTGGSVSAIRTTDV